MRHADGAGEVDVSACNEILMEHLDADDIEEMTDANPFDADNDEEMTDANPFDAGAGEEMTEEGALQPENADQWSDDEDDTILAKEFAVSVEFPVVATDNLSTVDEHADVEATLCSNRSRTANTVTPARIELYREELVAFKKSRPDHADKVAASKKLRPAVFVQDNLSSQTHPLYRFVMWFWWYVFQFFVKYVLCKI